MKKINSLLLIFFILFSIACGNKSNEVKVQRKDITETVFASGTLEPENKYNLTAQTEGYIEELKFNQGDTVKAGQTLAIIDNKTNNISATSAENLLQLASINASNEGPTLKQALFTINLLKEKSEQDSIQVIRYQKLLQSNSVSKLEFENANISSLASKTNYLNGLQNYRLLKQQTEQQYISQQAQRDINNVGNSNNEIKAVYGGKVYKKLKENGDYVRRGDVIAVIGNANDFFAKLNIDESNISKIKIGQKTNIQLNTNKTDLYEGYISEILPAFEESSQSFICYAKFKNETALKISGTQLQANILIGTKLNALVIPRNYLDFGNKVLLKGNKEASVVKTGFVSTEWVEIIDGLKENDVVVNQNR